MLRDNKKIVDDLFVKNKKKQNFFELIKTTIFNIRLLILEIAKHSSLFKISFICLIILLALYNKNNSGK